MENQQNDQRNKGGRPSKAVTLGSVAERLKPFGDALGVHPARLAAEVAAQLAPRHERLKRVLEAWDEIGHRERRRSLAFDNCLKAAGCDREEFLLLAEGYLAAKSAHLAQTKIKMKLPEIADRALTEALSDDGSKMRQRIMESNGLLLPPPGQTINVTAQAQAASVGGARAPRSFAEWCAQNGQEHLVSGEPRALDDAPLAPPPSFESFCFESERELSGREAKMLRPAAPTMIDVEPEAEHEEG